ncbi:plasmodesmata-located protein 6-like [Spinacia oleracea]|uniref:Plasmodesmata-located protein 6-like n=1 Tax=Spinacia oleracea TaxID=3562 RepID=A0A9R0IUC0_SPIOL|nr:plasmodesmata-located protein 6-like [Spinacia oleracea]
MKQAIIQARFLILFLVCKSIYGQQTSTLITENAFLGISCSKTVPRSAMYGQNFIKTLAALVVHADLGHLSGSSTEGSDAEAAQGLYYCRGSDTVSANECAACVRNVTSGLADSVECATGNSAIVWRGFCTVQVANFAIIGQLQTEPKNVRP